MLAFRNRVSVRDFVLCPAAYIGSSVVVRRPFATVFSLKKSKAFFLLMRSVKAFSVEVLPIVCR